MSKFRNVGILGDGNIVGSNNHQNTNTVNNHYHNRSPRNSCSDDALAGIIGFAIILGGLVWWFFNHIDQAYYYLGIAVATSPLLATAGLCLLLMTNQIENADGYNFLGSAISMIVLLYLVLMARNHAPIEVIQMASETKVLDFWGRLSDHGKTIVTINFSSAVLLLIATITAHMASFRQFAYAMAHPEGKGLWYSIYTLISIFKLKVALPIITTIALLVFAALNGVFN